jgi:hypothetical protein
MKGTMMKQKFICLIIFACAFLLCKGTGYSYEQVRGTSSCKGCHYEIQYWSDFHNLHTAPGLISCVGCHQEGVSHVRSKSCAACHDLVPCDGEGGHESIAATCLECHVECQTKSNDNCLAETVLEKKNPKLVELRTYRDEVLSSNMAGRAMIKMYYVIGGPVAKICDYSPTIKKYVRKMVNMLMPAIEDSLYDEDK